MKKLIFIAVLVLSWLITTNYQSSVYALADWWQRSDVLPTQPSLDRRIALPTLAPIQPTLPQPSVAPTIAPTNKPPIGGTTPSDPGGGGSGSGGNSCDPGKSYVGPYCGWSPSVSNSGGGGGSSKQSRIGGPQVLGLSNTSSSDMALSDIILLAGVLCLALYARSKFDIGKTL